MSTTIKPVTEPIWVIATNNSDVYIPAVVNVGTEFTTGQPIVEEYKTRELLLVRLDELGIEYEEEEYVADEVLPPEPDWDGFNAAILINEEFNEYYGRGLSIAPAITAALPAALVQVESSKLGAFKLVYSGFCSVLGVVNEDRVIWGDIARGYNLPMEFISIIEAGS